MKQSPITVGHLKRFLDNFDDEALIKFSCDHIPVQIWEMYQGLGPVITLQPIIVAQDHIADYDTDGPGAA